MPKLLILISAICYFGLLAAEGRAQTPTGAPPPPDEAVTVATEEIRLNVAARDGGAVRRGPEEGGPRHRRGRAVAAAERGAACPRERDAAARHRRGDAHEPERDPQRRQAAGSAARPDRRGLGSAVR